MGTPTGERDRRIVFQSGAPVRGALGREPISAWSYIGRAWAKVLFGTGSERRAAGAEGASQAATFRVLSNGMTRGVTTDNRILFDRRGWDITSISPIGVNDEIEFVAVAAKG